jgi:hypothetical protein
LNTTRNAPVEIIHKLGDTLRKYLENDLISINKISEESGLHWQTTKTYLSIINLVQHDIPRISIEKSNNSFLVRVVSRDVEFSKYTEKEKIMISLYLGKATIPENSISTKEMDKRLVDNLLAENLIKATPDSKIYLTELGVLNILPKIGEYTDSYDKKVSDAIGLERSFEKIEKEIQEIKGMLKSTPEIKSTSAKMPNYSVRWYCDPLGGVRRTLKRSDAGFVICEKGFEYGKRRGKIPNIA